MKPITLDDLSPELLRLAYVKMERHYRTQDAMQMFEDVFKEDGYSFSVDDADVVAEIFLAKHDSNLSDNAQMENIIREYLEEQEVPAKHNPLIDDQIDLYSVLDK